MKQMVCLLLVAIGWLSLIHAELFTAIVELERTLRAEYDIAQELKTYVEKEQRRINALRSMADSFEQHSARALQNPEKHLSNPVNAFLVVKRFTSDWNKIVESYINSNTTNEFLDNVAAKTSGFPSQEDLSGAAAALMRLQDTYALPTDRLARGEVQDASDSTLMTAEDCFELGRLAYLEGDHYHTILWMQEALNLLDLEQNPSDPTRATILDYLSYSMFMQGNIHEALRLTEELLTLDSSNVRIQDNRNYFRQMIAQSDDADSVAAPTEIKNVRPLDDYRSSEEFQAYEKLCRGEKTHEYAYESDLTCQYRRHHPIFFLYPLKEEVLYLKPRIVIFHGVLSDQYIAKIKELALPRLNRATVQNSVTGKLETANYRVSKSAWLRDEEHICIDRVSKIAEAMTNLTLNTVEELQVVNYGIGGHYEPHFDFARKREVNAFEEWRGNRVATFICYMSDVEAGGATVFPHIGARVVPEKGSCAVWYNLHLSGEGDYYTRHAACPVLLGSKWVCNKWFHERGQEFVRPCGLSNDTPAYDA